MEYKTNSIDEFSTDYFVEDSLTCKFCLIPCNSELSLVNHLEEHILEILTQCEQYCESCYKFCKNKFGVEDKPHEDWQDVEVKKDEEEEDDIKPQILYLDNFTLEQKEKKYVTVYLEENGDAMEEASGARQRLSKESRKAVRCPKNVTRQRKEKLDKTPVRGGRAETNGANLANEIPGSAKREALVFRCQQCGKSSNWKNFQRHMRTHSTEKRPYKCSKCRKRFTTKDYLNHHLKLHNEAKRYICSVCGTAFSRKDYLTKHEIARHINIKPYMCAVCGKCFTQKSTLTSHNQTHDKSNVIYPACDFCGKFFSHKSTLRAHVENFHLNTQATPSAPSADCDQPSLSKSALDDPASDVKLNCTACREKFCAIHDNKGKKIYPCSSCERIFKYPSALKRHMLMHTGDKPFSCYVCGKTFKKHASVRVHIRKNHPDYDHLGGAHTHGGEFLGSVFLQ